MKTVQYYLNNLNLEKIVDTYYNRIEDSLLRDADNNITIEELKLTVKYNIVKYIEKLKSIEIKKENTHILLAYEGYLFESMTEPVFSLINIEELKENRDSLTNVTTYAYEFSLNEEIMGYLISDNEYTQNYIYDLIADVLYEASFFGYNEENKIKQKEELIESVREIEEGVAKTVSWEECKKKLFSNVYIYKPDKYQSELKSKIMETISEYNRYSLEKELSNLLKELDKNETKISIER